jgi:hypothetical protein
MSNWVTTVVWFSIFGPKVQYEIHAIVICSFGIFCGWMTHSSNAYFEVSRVFLDLGCICIIDCLDISESRS